MRKITIFCLFFLALYALAYCGQVSRIELTDGSVINGEVISFMNGVYTINSGSFGEIKVEAAKVSKIVSDNNPLSSLSANPNFQMGNLTQAELEGYKQRLLGTPENAAIITGLAADSEIQELAKDPQVQNAVKAGDIQALMKNEKFMDIVNNPDVQETVKKIKQ